MIEVRRADRLKRSNQDDHLGVVALHELQPRERLIMPATGAACRPRLASAACARRQLCAALRQPPPRAAAAAWAALKSRAATCVCWNQRRVPTKPLPRRNAVFRGARAPPRLRPHPPRSEEGRGSRRATGSCCAHCCRRPQRLRRPPTTNVLSSAAEPNRRPSESTWVYFARQLGAFARSNSPPGTRAARTKRRQYRARLARRRLLPKRCKVTAILPPVS